jgi:hypothetical protein
MSLCYSRCRFAILPIFLTFLLPFILLLAMIGSVWTWIRLTQEWSRPVDDKAFR